MYYKFAGILGLLLLVQGCHIFPCISKDYRHSSISLEVAHKASDGLDIAVDNALIKETLQKHIKKELIQIGYLYKDINTEKEEQADLKGIIKYDTQITADKIQLDVKLEVYDSVSGDQIWTASAFNMAGQYDIISDLIKPIVKQITFRFPYPSHLGGVGVIVGSDLKVKGFSNSSPAKEAGLELNDIICKVNNKNVKDVLECQNFLRGKTGTKVSVLIQRKDENLYFRLARISLNEMLKRTTFNY